MEAFDDAVRLRAPDLGLAVLDAFELEEQLVGMAVGPAAELAAIVREYGLDRHAVLLEEGHHIGVQQMHGGQRHLVGVEAAPGEARAAVDGGLQVDLADRFQVTHEEGIDSHQIAAVVGLDVTFPELRAEAFERRHLFFVELHDAVGRGLLQSHQPVMLAEQAVAAPHAAHPARRHLDAGQRQFAGDPQGAVTGVGQAVVEDGLLDVLADPLGMRVAGTGDPVEQAVGTVGLEVAPDLIELLAAVADDAAGFTDVAKLAGKLEQSELAPCYLLLRGHVVLRSRLDVLHNTILTPAGSGVATPGVAALGASGPSLQRHPVWRNLSGQYRLSSAWCLDGLLGIGDLQP